MKSQNRQNKKTSNKKEKEYEDMDSREEIVITEDGATFIGQTETGSDLINEDEDDNQTELIVGKATQSTLNNLHGSLANSYLTMFKNIGKVEIDPNELAFYRVVQGFLKDNDITTDIIEIQKNSTKDDYLRNIVAYAKDNVIDLDKDAMMKEELRKYNERNKKIALRAALEEM